MEHIYIVYWKGCEGDYNCEYMGADRSIAEMAQKVASAKWTKINHQLAEVVAIGQDAPNPPMKSYEHPTDDAHIQE